MREILTEGERTYSGEETVGIEKFKYAVDLNWAKWPASKQDIHVLNGQFDKKGTLYAATDNRDIPVVKFSKDGAYLGSIGEGLFKKAHSIFLTDHETILVADTALNVNVIREITLGGELVRDFGTIGLAPDSGYDPNYYNVLLSEGRLPTDEKWLKNGEKNARLDSIRRRGRNFCRPCNMIVSTSGQYFVADGYGNAAVHRFNENGEYVTAWGEPGNGLGQFRLVHDVHEDALGRLWVSDRENKRVQIFDQSGVLLAVIHGNLMRIGATWTEGVYTYVGELDGGVSIFDQELNCLVQIGAKGSIFHAHGITVDREGNIFLFTNKKNRNNLIKLEKQR